MRTRVNRLTLFLLVLGIMLTLVGCGGKTDTAGGPAAPDDGQEILITGLQDSGCKITVGDLKKLPPITKKAQATRANGETVRVKATGSLLEDVLQQKGKSVKDYSTIRFTAEDGYSIAVPADIFKNRPIILAYQIGGQALDVENRPIRVVIPGERAMYWVKTLARIDLETGAEQTPIKKVVFLETAVKALPQEDYQYFDSTDKAVKTKDLVASYAGADEAKSVFIKASDGLYKNETPSNFRSAYIKITGQEAPKLLAPHWPQGMHVRDLLYINYGETSFLAYSQEKKVLSPQTLDGQSGIAFSDIIKQTGLSRAAKYQFNSLDGQSLELTVNELGSGLIYENGRGTLVFRCPGTAADKTVENLLSIECKQ
ncbi:MAG: molybdopterin-dependent oxidoreductase [Syntrophomonas sp.]|nr:molybdopterin-dependent oxidoreductase [Syntrophomonas sp.]